MGDARCSPAPFNMSGFFAALSGYGEFFVVGAVLLASVALSFYAFYMRRVDKAKIERTAKEIEAVIARQIKESKLKSTESLYLGFAFKEYVRVLRLLELYDEGATPVVDESPEPVWYPDKNAVDGAIEHIRKNLYKDADPVGFGRHMDRSRHVYDAFDLVRQEGRDAEFYPKLAAKAAHLFYFVIKNHYFVDGNKRIAAMLMLWFMDRNDMLATGEEGGAWDYLLLTYNVVYVFAIFVAKSKPEDKEVVVGLLAEIIDTYRLKKDFLPE